MEESFLQKLAGHLIAKHGDQLDELVLILPSRRARIFLIEAFKEKSKGASWLPSIRSMEDFIAEISDLQTVDQLDLIFEFYDLYKEIEGKKADPLEDFMGWANILLYDFNEIDRNLIEADLLFSYLNEIKAVELWNPEGEDLTEFQQKYLSFWKKFTIYYQKLKERLIDKKLAYQGLLYKEAIQKIEKCADHLLRHKNYCFAGFNALTKAEEEFIKNIKNHRNVEFIWDGDHYYLNDPVQEAGMFLRKKYRESPDSEWISEGLSKGEKEINIYGISGNIGQAKLLAELLASDESAGDKSLLSGLDKAVILADENLLLPVLESLPKEVSPLNITMGYPVNQTSYYQFFYNYIHLFQKLGKQDSQSGHLFHKDLFAFLEDALLLKCGESKNLKSSIEKLKLSASHYYPILEVQQQTPDSLKFLFNNDLNLIARMQGLVHLLKESGQLEEIEMEILYHFFKLFNRLEEIHQRLPLEANSLLSIYRQIISRSNLSFVGEPLSGLQIMGVLESRTLDFREIYICSMNEGILPAGKSQNSLIPFHIKKEFKLPTHKEKDAIFAYHFYRLLQRAEKVHLIYNSSVDVLKGGEKSRFIEQLLYEGPKKNPNLHIKEINVEPLHNLKQMPAEKIQKDDAILEAIIEKLESGLSPSAINTYLSCPLDFYYKYVLGLKEDQSKDQEDELEDSLFGTLLHDALEDLYTPYVGLKLSKSEFEKIREIIKPTLEKAFLKNKIEKWDHGKPKMVFEVCSTYLDSFLDMEIERSLLSPIEIEAIEASIEWEGELEIKKGVKRKLKLKGKVDRVEKQASISTIIDYKSGKVEPGDLKSNSIEAILDHKSNKFGKQLQLMIYQFLYSQQYQSKPYESGIISFRDLKSGIIPMKNLGSDAVIDLLKAIVGELLNSSVSFEHNSEANYCKFCRDLQKRKGSW